MKQPLQSDITEDNIKLMVDSFYHKVRQDAHLGPIFNPILEGRWEHHLPIMYAFWSSVLLASGRYHGNPISKHYRVQNLKPEDFGHWLELFQNNLADIYVPETAERIYRTAERIGQVMQYGLFVRPLEKGWVLPSGQLVGVEPFEGS